MRFGKFVAKDLVGSVLLGTASGYLSQTGAVTVLSRTPGKDLPDILDSPWVRRLALASAAGEMLANAHISFLPSRKSPGPLFGRIMFGAGSAALLAYSRKGGIVGSVIAGGVSAAATSIGASDSRAVIARHVPDPLVGWAENALAVGLSVLATRR